MIVEPDVPLVGTEECGNVGDPRDARAAAKSIRRLDETHKRRIAAPVRWRGGRLRYRGEVLKIWQLEPDGNLTATCQYLIAAAGSG